jgi:hypothetical protein
MKDYTYEHGVDTCWRENPVPELSVEIMWDMLFYRRRFANRIFWQHCGYDNLDKLYASKCYNPRHWFLATVSYDPYTSQGFHNGFHQVSPQYDVHFRKGKFSADDIRHIMKISTEMDKWGYPKYSQTKLGKMYGVGGTVISDILLRQTYRDVVPYDDWHFPTGIPMDFAKSIRIGVELLGFSKERHTYRDTEKNYVLLKAEEFFKVSYDAIEDLCMDITMAYDDTTADNMHPTAKTHIFRRFLGRGPLLIAWKEISYEVDEWRRSQRQSS